MGYFLLIKTLCLTREGEWKTAGMGRILPVQTSFYETSQHTNRQEGKTLPAPNYFVLGLVFWRTLETCLQDDSPLRQDTGLDSLACSTTAPTAPVRMGRGNFFRPCPVYTKVIHFYRKPLRFLLSWASIFPLLSSRCGLATCCDHGDGILDSEEVVLSNGSNFLRSLHRWVPTTQWVEFTADVFLPSIK